MIKRGILCVFIALAITFSGFADGLEFNVSGTAPQFKLKDSQTFTDLETVNQALRDAFGTNGALISEVNTQINDMLPDGINLDGLLSGFGSSAVFASHAATMRGYGDFKSFSISAGAMVGLQLPKGTGNALFDGIRSGDLFSDPGSLLDGLFENFTGSSEDLTIGVIPQALDIEIGFKPSAFFKALPKSLSLGLRVGYFGFPSLIENLIDDVTLSYNTFTIGATANYQLIPTVSLAGLLKWRGINIGAGFIYQKTTLGISVPIDLPEYTNGTDNEEVSFEFTNPKASINLDINTYTIPVEVSTAITLLIVNIPIGFGFDVGFGTSNLSAGVTSGLNVTPGSAAASYIEQASAGSLSATVGGGVDVKVFNWKITTGIGITFGDFFIIDIPMTYYFDDGFNIGVTVAVRF